MESAGRVQPRVSLGWGAAPCEWCWCKWAVTLSSSVRSSSSSGSGSGSHSLSSSSSSLSSIPLHWLLPLSLTPLFSNTHTYTHTLRRLHTNEAGEGGGLSLPIRDGEGVSVGCGSSNPRHHHPLDVKRGVSGKVAGDGLHCGSAITTRTRHTSNTPTRTHAQTRQL